MEESVTAPFIMNNELTARKGEQEFFEIED
jgi:hypothetical protein